MNPKYPLPEAVGTSIAARMVAIGSLFATDFDDDSAGEPDENII
jgi:hypothetical protein